MGAFERAMHVCSQGLRLWLDPLQRDSYDVTVRAFSMKYARM